MKKIGLDFRNLDAGCCGPLAGGGARGRSGSESRTKLTRDLVIGASEERTEKN